MIYKKQWGKMLHVRLDIGNWAVQHQYVGYFLFGFVPLWIERRAGS